MNDEGIDQLRSVVMVETRTLENLREQLSQNPKSADLIKKITEQERKLNEYLRLLQASQAMLQSKDGDAIQRAPSRGDNVVTGSMSNVSMGNKKLLVSSKSDAKRDPVSSSAHQLSTNSTGGGGSGATLTVPGAEAPTRRIKKDNPHSLRQDSGLKSMQSEPGINKRWSSLNTLNGFNSASDQAVPGSLAAAPASTPNAAVVETPQTFRRSNQSMRFASVEDFRRASVRVNARMKEKDSARPVSMMITATPTSPKFGSGAPSRQNSVGAPNLLVDSPTEELEEETEPGLLNVELTEMDLSPSGAASLKLSDLGNNVESLALTRCRMQNLVHLDLTPAVNCPSHTNLRTLSLVGNELTSKALNDPKLFLSLTSLLRLYLGHNQLDSIPHSVLALSWLQTLGLSHNSIKSIHPSIGNLKKLQYLSLDSNELSELHPNILRLKNLRGLVISNNQLYVEPNELKQLHNFCTVLSIHGNPYLQPDVVRKRRLIKAGAQYRGVKISSLTPNGDEDYVFEDEECSTERIPLRKSFRTPRQIPLPPAAFLTPDNAFSTEDSTTEDLRGFDDEDDDQPVDSTIQISTLIEAGEGVPDRDEAANDDDDEEEDELPESVAEWLQRGDLQEYLPTFEAVGYKHLLACTTITTDELDRLNIKTEAHRVKLLDMVEKLKIAVGVNSSDFETSV